MRKVNLKELVLKNYKEFTMESIHEIHFPSLIDGNRPVNRAILLALKELSKGTTKTIPASNVLSTATSKYHLHSERAMYASAVFMSESRFPLIKLTGKSGEAGAYNIDSGSSVAVRYIRMALTPIGVEFVNSVLVSNYIPNYDNTLSIPETFTGLIPNNLLQTYWDITIGVSTVNMPLCPEEVFRAMKFLNENNLEATFEELSGFIKGFDTEKWHTHITTSQNLYSLIEEGDSNTSILSAMQVTPNKIYIKGAPLGRTFKSIAKDLEEMDDNRERGDFSKKHIKTFRIDSMVAPPSLIDISYTPLNGATPADIRNEIYSKTMLHREYKVEYVGILPTKIGDTVLPKRLHKMSVREMMITCIQNAYRTRQVELTTQIDGLKKDRIYNELFEKITRPTTTVWLKPLIDRRDKKELLVHLANNGDTNHVVRQYIGRDIDTVIGDIKIGDIIIKGGISKEESDIVFQRQGASMLARLDDRQEAVDSLLEYTNKLQSLQNQLTHDSIIKYISNKLDYLANLTNSKRRSPVFYKDKSSDIRELKQQLLIQNTVLDKMKDVKVHCIIYKDNSIELKLSLENIDFNRVKDIRDITMDNQIYVVTKDANYLIKDYVLDIPLQYKDFVKEPVRGVFALEHNKLYVFVTNRGRVKVIPSNSLVQQHTQTVGFYLNDDEIVYPPLILDDDISLPDYAIEVLTVEGIKRMDMSDISISNKKGWKQMFSTRPTNVLDFRLILKEEENALVYTNKGITRLNYNKLYAYKRNVSRELNLVENTGLELKCFVDNKLMFIGDKLLENPSTLLEETFSKGDSLISVTLREHTSNTKMSNEDLAEKMIHSEIGDNLLKTYAKPIW